MSVLEMKTSSDSAKSILARFKHWLEDRKKEKQLIEYVVKAVEPKIANARGFRKRLRKPIQICQEHCRLMVHKIPGPIHLEHADYYDDPLIRAAFIGSEKIEDLLENQQLKFTPDMPTGPERFALLTMTHRETTEFGSRQEGNMVIGDASLQSVTFSDHKIVGLSTTLESSRQKFEELCFTMILEAVSNELAAKRTDLAELREHRERLHAMSQIFSDGNQARSYFGHDNSQDHEKLEKVEKMLKENKDELAHALQTIETPEDWLQLLTDHLRIPEKILNFKTITMRLDWRNVLTEKRDEKAHNINLAQCSLAEGVVRDAVLISYIAQK